MLTRAINAFTGLFRPLNAQELRDALHTEACVLYEEHKAAAEHHQALARMYSDRALRLRSQSYAPHQAEQA